MQMVYSARRVSSEQESAAMFDFKRGGLGTIACEHL